MSHLVSYGASPRATIGLDRCARARAWLDGRDYVSPDDIKTLAQPVLAHRLIVSLTDTSQDNSSKAIVDELLETVPVPGARVKKQYQADRTTESN